MSEFASWLLGLVQDVFTAAWDFVVDLVIGVFDLFLTAILAVIAAIPVPTFMQGGFQQFFSGVPSEILYFAAGFRLPECFAILGAAVLFRLTRKAVTLFQW